MASDMIQLKKNNKGRVYKYIYANRQASKQDIAYSLSMSLPTVTQNLKELLEEGFIKNDGYFESTGGRKASVYKCLYDAKVAIGVQLLRDDINIVACDLLGNDIKHNRLPITFKHSEEYYQIVGTTIKEFITELDCRSEILGIAIALQGLVDEKKKNLIYGRILDDSQITAECFSKYIGRSCILLHDSEAAAFAESFFRPNLRDSVYLFLNKNLGSCFILNGKIYSGNHQRGSVVEHMCLVTHGMLCYCGRHGCAECYCSADSLILTSGDSIDTFFSKLRLSDEKAERIWTEYLHYLTNIIYNILMMQDVDIIIGGLVRKYMNDEDVERIYQMLKEKSDFQIYEGCISLERSLNYPAAIGASLYFISQYLEEF